MKIIIFTILSLFLEPTFAAPPYYCTDKEGQNDVLVALDISKVMVNSGKIDSYKMKCDKFYGDVICTSENEPFSLGDRYRLSYLKDKKAIVFTIISSSDPEKIGWDLKFFKCELEENYSEEELEKQH